jgi:hypothetical protein
MNFLDIVIILISLAATGIILFRTRNRLLDSVVLSCLMLVTLLHGWIDHFRFQMVPIYAVVLTIILVLIRRVIKQPSIPSRSKYKKGLLSLTVMILTVASIYLSYLLPIFTMPEPTGSYAIGTLSRQLTDSSRVETYSKDPKDKRELMINIWYPVDTEQAKVKSVEHYPSEFGDAISLVFGIPKQLFSYITTVPTHVVQEAAMSSAEASYPVLLFSPGVRSTRFQSMTTIEELVSHGYIVVGIDHPYTSAKVMFPDGHDILYVPEPEFPTSTELYDNNVTGVAIRAADSSFVLDTLTNWNTEDPNGLLTGRLDLDHVGIFGHSYGGATTAEALAQDPRFKAGVSLEGAFWGTVSHTGLKQPFMYLLTGDTAKSLEESETDKDKVFFPEFNDDLDSVMNKSTADTYFMTVDHLFHQSFTDLGLLSPALFTKDMDPVHNIDITRSYVRAFFDQYLKGVAQPLLEGTSPKYPEVKFDPTYTKKRQ